MNPSIVIPPTHGVSLAAFEILLGMCDTLNEDVTPAEFSGGDADGCTALLCQDDRHELRLNAHALKVLFKKAGEKGSDILVDNTGIEPSAEDAVEFFHLAQLRRALSPFFA